MNDLPRRAILRGTAISALAMAATSSSSRPIASHGLEKGLLSGPLTVAADRAALAALPDPAAGQIVYLAEGAREGLFKCIAGTMPAGDRLQGLRVISATGDVYYERLWDGTHGRPEWFGAIVNNGDMDCADAIEACYALCPVTELSQADYYVRRTVRLATSYRRLRGAGHWAEAQGQGTRIILHRDAPGIHRDDIMVVGTTDQPTVRSEEYPRENFISHFALVRDGKCTPHPSGDITRYPTGLRLSFVFRCNVDHVMSIESSVGFLIGGVVYTKVDDCCALRQQPGTTAERDYNVGFYLNGHISFGYAGGNASLYMNRCLAVDQHPQHADPIGLLAKGCFVDSFIDNFESARMATGMVFAVDGARGFSQTIDLHIRNPILDGVSRYGINIDLDGTSTASIEIIDPYIAAGGGPGADKGIAIHDGAGLVTITGGQIFNTFRGGTLYFARTFGVRVQGTKIQQSAKAVVIDDAGSMVIEPQINNFEKMSTSFAIEAKKMVRSIVRPSINGWHGGGFAGGVTLDTASHHNEIDGSAINPDFFSTPDARFKVWYKGADARSGASGAAFNAAGNRLVGVTD